MKKEGLKSGYLTKKTDAGKSGKDMVNNVEGIVSLILIADRILSI